MRHFLDIADWQATEISQILTNAQRLKSELKKNGTNDPVLKGKTLAMVFEKPSLRTRASFDIGMQQLGGFSIYLGPAEIGFNKRESVADIARVLSVYADIVMARVFQHKHLKQLAQHSRVPIINGLSDESHPCQVLADALTIVEHFGRMEGLKVAYVGDGNNVAASLMMICAKLGARFAIASPNRYTLPEADFQKAVQNMTTPVPIESFSTAEKAVANADVVYTDTWVSMGQEAERDEKIRHFAQFQVTSELMSLAKPTAIFMHCLPAHRGEEVTDEVADSKQSVIFQQAENRLHAQKALLVRLLNQ